MHRFRTVYMLAMSTSKHRLRHSAGFTLIELIVTLAIAAILLMYAIPSFVAFQRNSQLTSAANSLVGALTVARGEALKRGASVLVVPASGTDWASGSVVFVDINNDQTLSTGEPVILQQGSFANFLTAAGQGTGVPDLAYVMFDGSGYSKTSAASFQSATITIARSDVSANQQPDQTRIVVIAKTGRIRSCKPSSSSDNLCSATSTE